MTNEKNIISACKAYGVYPYQSKSSYPDSDAQRNLEGRTHYADPDTLRYFKARILRSTHSNNGLFYLIQESLECPIEPFNGVRARRNVVFDLFGSVVNGREVFHKTAKQADKEYSELREWIDNEANAESIANTLREYIASDSKHLNEALEILNNSEVTA
jgi:hypothetical protein